MNIIRLISASDKHNRPDTNSLITPIPMDWLDALEPDNPRAEGMLIFRLMEKPSFIFVHESIKRRLLEAGFDRLSFIPYNEVV